MLVGMFPCPGTPGSPLLVLDAWSYRLCPQQPCPCPSSPLALPTPLPCPSALSLPDPALGCPRPMAGQPRPPLPLTQLRAGVRNAPSQRAEAPRACRGGVPAWPAAARGCFMRMSHRTTRLGGARGAGLGALVAWPAGPHPGFLCPQSMPALPPPLQEQPWAWGTHGSAPC